MMKLSLIISVLLLLLSFFSIVEIEQTERVLKNPKVGKFPRVNILVDNLRRNKKSPGFISIVSNNPNYSLSKTPISVESSGNTSVRYPKHRFSIQIGRSSDWLDGNNISLFDLYEDDDWTLDGAYRDKLLFRNKLNHDLFNEINGKGSTVNSTFVEVYLNNEYFGLYTLLEKPGRKFYKLPISKEEGSLKAKIIKHFFDLSHKSRFHIGYKINRAIARGIYKLDKIISEDKYLEYAFYKAQRPGADFFLDEPLTQGYDQKFPKQKYLPNSSNLKDLITFVNISTDKEFLESIWKKLDRESAINYFLLLFLNSGVDNLKANYILLLRDGIFYLRPWDLDNTFRSIHFRKQVIQAKYDSWGYESNLLYRRLLKSDPEFRKDLVTKWFELRKNIFSSKSLRHRFQQYYNNVSIDGALLRNHKKWNFKNPYDEFNLVLKWIDKRLDFVDNKLKNF